MRPTREGHTLAFRNADVQKDPALHRVHEIEVRDLVIEARETGVYEARKRFFWGEGGGGAQCLSP